MKPVHEITVGIKGAGEMASAIGWRLYQANMRKIFMMDIPGPMAVRREVSFCEAIHEGRWMTEDVAATLANDVGEVHRAWEGGEIAVLVDPEWKSVKKIQPDVIVDAILAKRNLGTTMAEAPLVIGLGPGFHAGDDVHMVIETNRGHHLGRIITSGAAEPNTGIPGSIGGYAKERVLRAPTRGMFRARAAIGDMVQAGQVVGDVAGEEVRTEIGGVIRGLIRSDNQVPKGLKLGDIDPRGDRGYCNTISDKARAIGGTVLEAILRVYAKADG
ncbi:MAG: EF2563 family selenium-dependent molybdenum hydroxylase system protein [Desulfobacterales bacterium]|nr:EF2563 family selenium-dependent molybdenum hydroxylase system protein [Desulfobacterales bacterium]